MFQPVESNANFPQQELAIGQFWKENRIYEKSLEQRAGAPPFVFYEGPPTANGMPHPGHCLTRAIKDLFPRYKTMRGFHCERKAGWDTHGLPVEVEVCKELGIHSKEEIEAYGIEPFIQKCQQSVWRYMKEWERMTDRIGFWVDLKNAYATYHQSYVESVWWSLKELYDRGLLYQGHKIVWWWAQGGTALSSGEVGEGYRSVADPSVYVMFPLLDDAGKPTDTSLLVWTTTPWTLPSNQFAAVHPELEYSVLGTEHDGKPQRLIVATALVETLRNKTKQELPEVDKPMKGSELIERRYLPPFDHYWQQRQDCGWRDSAARQRATILLNLDYEYSKDKTASNPDALSKVQKRQDEFLSHKPATGWQIVEAKFVTTDAGTGVVHIASAFGEDDMGVLEHRRHLVNCHLPLINAVASDGKFTHDGPEYCRGRWVKDCDKDIVRDLKQRGLLFHQEQYVHDYPFCPRAEQDALIQYPRQSWFIRTSDFKDDMLANNATINWLPEHIKDGRFGKFLETNVDWALSRERYWGTPLPIWKCQETGKMEAVGSYDELMSKPGIRGGEVWEEAKRRNPDLPDDLRIHKPYIDEIVYDSPFAKDAHMRRVPEVIDCWYDAGSMPFAQWGYRGESPLPSPPRRGEGAGSSAVEKFHSQFPADFISEAIDQTRGWFYAQLAISTLLWGSPNDEARMTNEKTSDIRHSSFCHSSFPYPHPFRNCIVLGHMLGEDGLKMSKRKRNYLPPDEIFDRYGADALRWYFFANQPPWTSIRYNEQSIKDSIPEFLLRLWNVYSFFVIYANIDGFDPAKELKSNRQLKKTPKSGDFSLLFEDCANYADSYRLFNERSELDRWILGELNSVCFSVRGRMDAYDSFGAAECICRFVDVLSNWYVRRSRDRFWATEKRSPEKLDAYWTLYECLLTVTKLIAPFVPFISETIWQNLARSVFGQQAPESVHLSDYPLRVGPSHPDSEVDSLLLDAEVELSQRMYLMRLISSLGRNARSAASLKVRQPLAKVEVILADTTHQAWLEEHAAVIKEELNVKQLEFSDDPSLYVEHEVVPNFKLLGPKLGKLLPKVKQWLGQQSGADLLANIRDNGLIDLNIDGQAIALTREEVEVRIKPRPGWTSANDQGVVVVLSTELTQELIDGGIVKDVIRLIQDRRKDIGCEYTDRIEVGLVTESADVRRAVEQFRHHILKETLATRLVFEPLPGVTGFDAKVGDAALQLFVRVAK
jgi:isoleucyl-tRNA synthetase